MDTKIKITIPANLMQASSVVINGQEISLENCSKVTMDLSPDLSRPTIHLEYMVEGGRGSDE